MFEKSLYDLIRGLRNHKGNEKEYINNSLRECRLEIRGPDMDVKATALLKLVYLEMFGHDMSWASFHVLEVMSSPKYLQKRVGYLGAVQSFRSDTEVLMLATNLLKKDLNSSLTSTITLPLVTLPHITDITLARSLLADLMPRLSHSNPNIRKKTVVAIYRLALIYPEILRPAWPRIKDLLLDEQEDPSVTAAVVNVVCELGQRRPQDFLPLAPRLFGLLVDGGNNWMAIKILKLFATLTLLETRLIKKLVPPLTNLIRTTPAMSLLYECVNGIIQGGILEGIHDIAEGEEIAMLCVSKLRGMIMIEGDPNLRYVALLAFNRIVVSHAHLVSLHEDIITSCIDDPDVSIRMQAFELGASMVHSGNLINIVERLMLQLKNAPPLCGANDTDRPYTHGVEPAADSEGEDPEIALQPPKDNLNVTPALPADYQISVIQKIVQMCSKDTYANVIDFEWYLGILVQLVKLVPLTIGTVSGSYRLDGRLDSDAQEGTEDVACTIGQELRNVAVRVSNFRAEAVNAAKSLITIRGSDSWFSFIGIGGEGVLSYAVWIVGEFASSLSNVHNTLDFLIHARVRLLSATTIRAYLQAIPKVTVFMITQGGLLWNLERKSTILLLVSRILDFLEPLSTHPNLEVQERAVELAELMRVAYQAVANHESDDGHGPLLLTKAIPSLFIGSDLNPMAPTAQRKVPLPTNLNLDTSLHRDLPGLLRLVEHDYMSESESAEFELFYNHRIEQSLHTNTASDTLISSAPGSFSYQRVGQTPVDMDSLASSNAERYGRNKDDPFYIASDDFASGTSTPFHEILRSSNGNEVDIDSIPIMDLDLGDTDERNNNYQNGHQRKPGKLARSFQIATDENIEGDGPEAAPSEANFETDTKVMGSLVPKQERAKKSLLEVDSSGLGGFSINDLRPKVGRMELERQDAADADMAKALLEVERVRLEMQRASERTRAADGVPPEGMLIKKKKKRKKALGEPIAESTSGVCVIAGVDEEASPGISTGVTTPKRKKKKKQQQATSDAQLEA